jgi:toxin HigB-1
VKIRNYRNEGTFDIAVGRNSKAARQALPVPLQQTARKRFALMKAVKRFDELKLVSLGLHRLSGDRSGQWSVRINDQYRICFVLEGEEFRDVEIVDYH